MTWTPPPLVPLGMSAENWRRISRLPGDRRNRVLERAAIMIFDGGLSPAEADERALAAEGYATQQAIGGAK